MINIRRIIGEEKIYSVWTLFLLFVFIIPLERIGGISALGVNIRFSQILVMIIFGYLFLWVGYKRKGEVDLSFPVIAYIAYIIWSMFTLIFAKEQMRGLQILIFSSFMLLVPLACVFIINTKRKVMIVAGVVLVSAFLVSLFGAFQFIGDIIGLPQAITGLSDRYIKTVIGLPRIQSTFIEPLYLANFMLLPLMLSIFLGLRRETKNRGAMIALSCFFIAIIFLTLSKGGIAVAALLVFGVLIFYFRAVFSRQNIPYFIIIILLSTAVFYSLSSIYKNTLDIEKITEKAVSILTGGSINERKESFEVAIDAYHSSPIVGIGVGNFGPYFSGYPTQQPDYGWPIVNNQFLEVLAETGIVGLVIFIIFIFSIIVRSLWLIIYSKDEDIRIILVAATFSFIGVSVQYLTFSTLYIMHIWFLIGFILAIQNIAKKEIEEYLS